MIFSTTAGSSGSGDECFFARLPLVLSPGLVLQLPEGKHLASKPGGIQLEKLHHDYIVTLGPFTTSMEAEDALSHLRAAALWCAIELSIGLQYPTGNGTIELLETPAAISENTQHIGASTGWTFIDGSYNAHQALIIPDHKRLVSFKLGKPKLVASIPVERFLEKFEEALSFDQLSQVVLNEKLKLAIEIAMSHRFEVSERAQFIALVTSLEALLPDAPAAKVTRQVIPKAAQLIKEDRNQHDPGSSEWKELDRLLSRVNDLKKESISARIRTFVAASLARHPTLGNDEVIENQILTAYDVRSKLLHQGHVPSEQLTSGLEFLRTFVPKLLSLLFREDSSSY